MNERAASACGACGKATLISWKSDKWGRCAFCIVLAIAGTIMGWSFTLSFKLLYPDARIVMGLACLSLCFTLALLVHAISHLLRGRGKQAA